MTDLSLFDLSGKVALVTGSSRGLGRAIAEGLSRAGAKIVITGRSFEQVEASTSALRLRGGDALGICADVTRRDECERLVKETVAAYGRIDVMVANHGGGVAKRVPAIEETDESWDAVIRLNLTAAYYCCQSAARVMIRQGHGGAIIVVSSTSSQVAHPSLLAYGAAKAGADQMVRQFAAELGIYKIRVNAINPGFTTHRPRAPKIDPNSEFDKHINSRTPLGRSGDPYEFAGPVIFLASEAASYVTGVTLPVEGGYLIT